MGAYSSIPYNPPDPSQAVERALSLRQMMQQGQLVQGQQQLQQGQIQMQQQQIKDQQAMTQAMQQWDGKDYNALPGLVMKQGASAQAVMGLKTNIIKQQQELANLSKDQLANEKVKGDYIAQQIDNVKGLPPEQQPQAFEAAKADLVQRGYLPAQQAQGLQYQGPQQLDVLEKTFMGHSAALEAASKQADLSAKAAQLPGQQAKSEQEQRANVASQLATAASQEDYQNRLDQLPHAIAKQFPAQFDKDAVLQAGMTPAEMAHAPFELQAAKSWLAQHPGKTMADFNEYNKKLVPAYNFNLQTQGAANVQLNPSQQATAQAIIDGRMSPPGSFALKTPYWQAVMGSVFQQDPQWSEQRAQLRKGYTVGKQSGEINAINTAMGHVGVLGDAIDALNNGNVKVLNGIANQLGIQVGKDQTTTFNTIVHRVGPELSKAYIGAGGSAGERGSDEKDFDPALGPQQLKSNVGMTAKLLRSKISSLQNQWDQNAPQGQDFQSRFIMPEAQKQLDKWAPQGTQNAAPQGGGKEIHYKIVNGQLVAQ